MSHLIVDGLQFKSNREIKVDLIIDEKTALRCATNTAGA